MDWGREERSESTDCADPTEDGGLSSDLSSLVMLIMNASCIGDPSVE